MKPIQIHDKTFVPYFLADEIHQFIAKIADTINHLTFTEPPLFLGVLNGSFMFCSDLLKLINHPSEIHFIKLQSYTNTQSTGKVNELIGLTINLHNRDVIVLEDIIDTGNTLEKILSLLKPLQPKSITIATLFFKPGMYQKPYAIDIIGKEISNEFIVGYGLDYNGLGRNLKDVYILS